MRLDIFWRLDFNNDSGAVVDFGGTVDEGPGSILSRFGFIYDFYEFPIRDTLLWLVTSDTIGAKDDAITFAEWFVTILLYFAVFIA